jgi:hypothetical protein
MGPAVLKNFGGRIGVAILFAIKKYRGKDKVYVLIKPLIANKSMILSAFVQYVKERCAIGTG